MPHPQSLIRHDGLKINYDPYAPEMVAKYGAPGKTDNEGFDPYSDSVGPGIYGGRVKRDKTGEIVIGRQYQGHNSKPGPVYAGGGYTPMSNALRWSKSHTTFIGKVSGFSQRNKYWRCNSFAYVWNESRQSVIHRIHHSKRWKY